MKTTSDNLPRSTAWIVTGACLALYAIALTRLAHGAESGTLPAETAAFWLVLFAVPAGLIYLLGLWKVANQLAACPVVWFVIILGLAMRIVIIAAPPTMEDDFYRYLWDGAVTANAVDPYGYSPTQVLWGSIGAESVPPKLVHLSTEAGPVFERINHPHLKTIYPPVAQLGFAVAYWMSPFSTVSLRLVFLAADVTTLLLLMQLLVQLRLPLVAIAWYWWNPLLLREVFNAGHMDVLILPFVTAALLLAIRRKYSWSMLTLALAGGVKLWPIILVPILLRPLFHAPARLVSPIVVLATNSMVVWLPAISSAFGSESGFLAYAAHWQNNAGAYSLIEGFFRQVLALIGDHYVHWSQLMARCAIGVLLLGWMAWQARPPIDNGGDMARRCLMITAGLFLLSPTQFPWYYVWLIPFLAMCPYLPLLAYSALLPLYYVVTFHPAIVWLEHVPVWLLLIGGIVWQQRGDPEPRPLLGTVHAEPVN